MSHSLLHTLVLIQEHLCFLKRSESYFQRRNRYKDSLVFFFYVFVVYLGMIPWHNFSDIPEFFCLLTLFHSLSIFLLQFKFLTFLMIKPLSFPLLHHLPLSLFSLAFLSRGCLFLCLSMCVTCLSWPMQLSGLRLTVEQIKRGSSGRAAARL